jgi:hypothetical protein
MNRRQPREHDTRTYKEEYLYELINNQSQSRRRCGD